MRVFDANPVLFRFAYALLALVRDVRLAVVNRVADVRFIFEDGFYLGNRPRILFFLGRVSVDISESTIAGVI